MLKIKHRLSLSLSQKKNSFALRKFLCDAFSGFLYEMSLLNSLETSMQCSQLHTVLADTARNFHIGTINGTETTVIRTASDIESYRSISVFLEYFGHFSR